MEWRGEAFSYLEISVDLPELGLEKCEAAEWKPQYNRCSFASVSNGLKSYEDGYFEEWFSATNIEICLSLANQRDLESIGFDKVAVVEAPRAKSDNRPSLSDADLQKWWQGKEKAREHLTQEELLTLARSSFPKNQISRERVRDLAGPRKRGPKGFGG